MQQRAGVKLKGGVGAEGDAHEQHADAVADRVVRGESAEPLLDQYRASPGGGGTAVQRQVRSDSAGRFYSTLDPKKKLFTKRELAKAHERKLKAAAMAERRTTPRDLDDVDYSSQMKQTSSGVRESPDVTYPKKPFHMAHSDSSSSTLLTDYERAPMGPPMREMLLSKAEALDEEDRTKEEQSMLDAPKQNMKTGGISMNHKLADSSVAAIMATLCSKLQAGTLSTTQNTALMTFLNAMTNHNKTDSAAALKTLNDAAKASSVDPRTARVHLKAGIEMLSLSLANVRFGDSEQNTLILWAFDPNLDPSGTETPLSEAIKSAVKGLGSAGLIPKPMATAATTQAIWKPDGSSMSSSSQVGV